VERYDLDVDLPPGQPDHGFDADDTTYAQTPNWSSGLQLIDFSVLG
jgi:hypothetical protein